MKKKQRLILTETKPSEIEKHLYKRIKNPEKIKRFMRELTKKKDPIYLGSWDGETRMVVGKKLVYSKCMKGDTFSLSYGVAMCVRRIVKDQSPYLFKFPSGAEITLPIDTPGRKVRFITTSNPRSCGNWLHEKFLSDSTYSVAKNMIEKINIAEMISSPCEDTDIDINMHNISISNYKYRNMKFTPYTQQDVSFGKVVYVEVKVKAYNDISRREADML